ncbi:hypothetical protein Tco_0409079 [Tanacetum coccineum]
MRTRSQTRNRPQQQVPPNIEPFNLEEPIENQAPPVVTMANQRTMVQLLQAPTEGYEDAIVVPVVTADNFELKHEIRDEYPPASGIFMDQKCLEMLQSIIDKKIQSRYSRSQKRLVAKVSTEALLPLCVFTTMLPNLKSGESLLLEKKTNPKRPTYRKQRSRNVMCNLLVVLSHYHNCPATDGKFIDDNSQQNVITSRLG